jgi:hypothetical protein
MDLRRFALSSVVLSLILVSATLTQAQASTTDLTGLIGFLSAADFTQAANPMAKLYAQPRIADGSATKAIFVPGDAPPATREHKANGVARITDGGGNSADLSCSGDGYGHWTCGEAL